MPTDSADGKDNVIKRICESQGILCIVDSLGFGSCMKECVDYLSHNKISCIYFIASFEKLLLDSNFIQNTHRLPNEILAILGDNPDLVCGNKEDFYTSQVDKLLQMGYPDNTIHRYNKSRLLRCFVADCCPMESECLFMKSGSKMKWILGDDFLKLLQMLKYRQNCRVEGENGSNTKSINSDSSNLYTNSFGS